jgi:taurine dioxygenase
MTRDVGAVVHRDALGELDAVALASLRDLVVTRGVVAVSGFGTAEEDLIAVADAFGPVVHHPLHELTGRLVPCSVIEDSAEHPPAGFPWHTDLIWLKTPPRFGFLQAVELPPFGGDTLWADLRVIHHRLTAKVRAACQAMTLVHAPASDLLATIARHHGPDVAADFAVRYGPVHLPLVREIDGRRLVSLCPMYTTGTTGLDDAVARQLLNALHHMLDDAANGVRWRWSVGDLLIWDEATTNHRALTDHAGSLRRMRRTVTGDHRTAVSP